MRASWRVKSKAVGLRLPLEGSERAHPSPYWNGGLCVPPKMNKAERWANARRHGNNGAVPAEPSSSEPLYLKLPPHPAPYVPVGCPGPSPLPPAEEDVSIRPLHGAPILTTRRGLRRLLFVRERPSDRRKARIAVCYRAVRHRDRATPRCIPDSSGRILRGFPGAWHSQMG